MSQSDELLVRSTRRASERFRSLCRVSRLLAALVPETDEGADLLATEQALEPKFNALATLDQAALEDEVRRLDSQLLQFEKKLEALDGGIPMRWFRDHFDAARASSVALTDYANLLGRHVTDNSQRLDRIQFLLTRVISFFVSPHEHDPERRRALLAEALPPASIDETSRQRAVAFLQDAALRVAGFESLSSLVNSGFFVDVRGFKLSLRQKLLDPEVMASAIELNEKISDNLHRLAAADAPAERALKNHLDEVDQHLKAIFDKLREDESLSHVRFEEWLANTAQRRSAATPIAKKKEKAPLRIPRPVTLFVLLVAAIFFARSRWPQSASVRPMSRQEVAAVSSILISGALAPAEAPRLFIGEIDKERWLSMSVRQRRQAAETLAERLANRGWATGTVMLEQEVAIQIDDGNVVLVQ